MKQIIKRPVNNPLIKRGILAMLGLLVVQFLVGMYLNFYTELPDNHPGTGDSYAPSIPWALAGHAGPALAIHVLFWILLTIGGLALLIRAIMSKRKAFIVGNSLGFLFILMAGSGGLTFLNRGGADNESMMMAIAFILAMIAYGVTL